MEEKRFDYGADDSPEPRPEPHAEPVDPPRVTLRSAREYVNRRARRTFVGWILGGVFVFLAISVTYGIQGNNYWPCALEFAAIAALAVGLEVWLRKRRASGSSTCQNCHRDLTGLPASGTCPDCDTPFRWNPPTDDEIA